MCNLSKKIKSTARRFIRPVATVRCAVAEEISPNANNGGLFSAGELAAVAQLLRVADPRQSFPRLRFPVAVVDELSPVATLLLHVEGKTRGTPDGLQTLIKINIENWMK